MKTLIHCVADSHSYIVSSLTNCGKKALTLQVPDNAIRVRIAQARTIELIRNNHPIYSTVMMTYMTALSFFNALLYIPHLRLSNFRHVFYSSYQSFLIAFCGICFINRAIFSQKTFSSATRALFQENVVHTNFPTFKIKGCFFNEDRQEFSYQSPNVDALKACGPHYPTSIADDIIELPSITMPTEELIIPSETISGSPCHDSEEAKFQPIPVQDAFIKLCPKEEKIDSNLQLYLLFAFQNRLQDDASISFTNEKLISLLEHTYGDALATMVSRRYELNKKASLTWGELKKVMVGVATLVKESDLKHLYAQLQSGDLQFQCGLCLDPSQIDLKKTFDQLSTAEISHLLQAFRSLPIIRNEQLKLEPIFSLCLNRPPQSRNFYSEDVFKRDASLLSRLDMSNVEFCSKHPKLAYSEYYAKALAYMTPGQGTIFSLPNSKGIKVYYKIHDELGYKADGVMCILSTPLILKDQGPIPVTITFRGTEVKLSGIGTLASVKRDIDPTGIGRMTFNNRAEDLMKMITDFMARYPDRDFTFTLNGHSLATVDIARLLTLLSNHIVTDPDNFSRIKGIRMTAHNPPRPEKALNDSFIALASKISIPIEINYVLFRDAKGVDDIVQTFGDVLLGAGIDSPNITTKVYVVQRKVPGGSIHSDRYFTSSNLREGYCKPRRIRETQPILFGKYHWDEATSSRTAWAAGTAISAVTTPLHYAGYGVVATTIETGRIARRCFVEQEQAPGHVR